MFFSFLWALRVAELPKIADGLFVLRFLFCSSCFTQKKISQKWALNPEASKKNEENFIYLGKVFLRWIVFCVYVNGKMFLLNLFLFLLWKCKKRRNFLEKTPTWEICLVEGKSNITRVNFSAFLLFLIWRELNKMRNHRVMVAKSSWMWCMRAQMKMRMEQCEAISFCGHFRCSLSTSFSGFPFLLEVFFFSMKVWRAFVMIIRSFFNYAHVAFYGHWQEQVEDCWESWGLFRKRKCSKKE